jgi:uncharacterized protein (DUF2252 family)
MATFAGMRSLDLWYARIEVDSAFQRFAREATSKEAKQFRRNVARARTKDSLKAFAKLTQVVDGEPRIIGDPPLVVPVEELARPDERDRIEDDMRGLIRSYRRTLPGDRRRLLERFRYVHLARKVVGVGSVGTRAWIVLMLGRDDGDPLFLQAKEAQASVLEPFLGRSQFSNHGQRVVEGQRLIQAASDIMLGWIRTESGLDGVSRDFYLRQLWDAKGSALVETMSPGMMGIYAQVCGWTLAKAHARSGDAVAIATYIGTSDAMDRALAAFAETYADQNERDYAALRDAVSAGQLEAQTGL